MPTRGNPTRQMARKHLWVVEGPVEEELEQNRVAGKGLEVVTSLPSAGRRLLAPDTSARGSPTATGHVLIAKWALQKKADKEIERAFCVPHAPPRRHSDLKVGSLRQLEAECARLPKRIGRFPRFPIPALVLRASAFLLTKTRSKTFSRPRRQSIN